MFVKIDGQGEFNGLEAFVFSHSPTYYLPLPEYWEVMELLVKHAHLECEAKEKVYYNLLRSKSNQVKALALLLSYHRAGRLAEVRGFAFQKGVIPQLDRYITRPVVVRRFLSISKRTLIAKYLAHLLFRVLGLLTAGRARSRDHVIRGWVEVSHQLYKDKFNDAVLLLYPFPAKITRQLKFLKFLIKRKKTFSFYGLPYRLYDLTKILAKTTDQAIVDFEFNAYAGHSKKLKRYEVIYTTDEFEAASLVLYQPLIQAGKTVFNTAHGVGLYSPFISYTKFYCLTKAQVSYYKKRNPNVAYEMLRNYDHDRLSIQHWISDTRARRPRTLVYVHQNMIAKDLKTENEFQWEILQRLQQFCGGEENYRLLVKVHPNTPSSVCAKLQSQGFKLIFDKEEAFREEPCFVNIYSTAYFEFSQYGPYVFVKNDRIESSVYFDHIETYTLDRLVEQLAQPFYRYDTTVQT